LTVDPALLAPADAELPVAAAVETWLGEVVSADAGTPGQEANNKPDANTIGKSFLINTLRPPFFK
jgi:hypothetical protein